MNRRDILKLAGAGGLAMALPLQRGVLSASGPQRMPQSAMPAPFSVPFRRPPVLRPTGTYGKQCFDGITRTYKRYDIRQQFTVAEIMPGYKTPFFGYNGVTPGPTIRAMKGQPITVFQANALHQPPPSPYQGSRMPSLYTNDPMQRSTSTHLHGSATLPMWDGYASDVTFPGQSKLYFYPNSQNGRTIWYHDHGVHHTSQNAYNGLAGMYILYDKQERQLGIPTGAPGSPKGQRRYDVPLVVRDAMFADNGELIYDDNSESGVYGDVLLANGQPWPKMRVEPRLYRFRILNASVSRSYEWQLHDGTSVVPMTVIGTDAGLVHEPQVVSSFRHGMAERYEILVDFSDYAGAKITWHNLGPKNNIDYDTTQWLMQFEVSKPLKNDKNNAVPQGWNELVAPHECMGWTEEQLIADGVNVRPFLFHRSNGQWQINNETWEDVIDSGYRHCMAEVEENQVEIWELTNSSGGWFHPVHIHLIDFQVLSRNGSAANVLPHERGPKDVVYVGENESVRVAMRFNGPRAGEGWPTPSGRYMMHCHNLVHEDHDMMMQFNVGDHDYSPDIDPITASAPWNW